MMKRKTIFLGLGLGIFGLTTLFWPVFAAPDGLCYSNLGCKSYLPIVAMPPATPRPVPYAPRVANYYFQPYHNVCRVSGELITDYDTPVYNVVISANFGSSLYFTITPALSATTSYTYTPFFEFVQQECPDSLDLQIDSFDVDLEKRFVPITAVDIVPDKQSAWGGKVLLITNTLNAPLTNVQAAIWDSKDMQRPWFGQYMITREITLQPNQVISIPVSPDIAYLPLTHFSAQGERGQP